MLSAAAITALSEGSVDENRFYLAGELDRKVYLEVKEALRRIHGKWVGGKAQAFQFPWQVNGMIQAIIETGKMPEKNPMAYFPTQPDTIDEIKNIEELAERLRIRAELAADGLCAPYRLLEPSAGTGGIARALRALSDAHQIDTVEILPLNQAALREAGFDPFCGDFLDYNTDYTIQYDWIVMNPPFSAPGDPDAYITHIEHARKMLAQDGTLIAIVPDVVKHQKDAARVRAFISDVLCGFDGQFHPLPAGSFKAAGTPVDTAIIVLGCPEENWKTTPHSGYPSFYAWQFGICIEHDCKRHSRLMSQFEQGGTEGFDEMVDTVLAEAFAEGIGLDPARRDEYREVIEERYRSYCIENGITQVVVDSETNQIQMFAA